MNKFLLVMVVVGAVMVALVPAPKSAPFIQHNSAWQHWVDKQMFSCWEESEKTTGGFTNPQFFTCMQEKDAAI